MNKSQIRHPWLAEFESSPVVALDDLIRGYASISPYERADAPDAARQLFGGLEHDDSARLALDGAVIHWIDERRRNPIPSNKHERDRFIREISEVFEIAAASELRDAARWFFEHRLQLTDWTSRLVESPARDAHAAFLRMLALMKFPLNGDSK